MNARRDWPMFMPMAGLFVACLALIALLYSLEQRHLTEVRDECLATASTSDEWDRCLTDYEVNSGWF